MGPLRELLATDQRQALDFFFLRLKDVCGPDVNRHELLYNASVLAHYAQVSTSSSADLAAPANLSAVFDNFVIDTSLLRDSVMMETAGAQCLVLAGFFEDQMRRRPEGVVSQSPFDFNCPSCSSRNARISSAIASSFVHCSL